MLVLRKSKKAAGTVPKGTVLLFCLLAVFPLFMPSSALAADFARPIMVNSKGSIQEMYKDNAAAKIHLSALQGQEHIYGIGPLSGLRGELMLFDSVPFESRINKGRLQLKSDYDESAAFLVWSCVPRWRKVSVPSSVTSLELLEMWLSSLSGQMGAPLPTRYPFIIKGRFDRIAWHVMNLKDDGKALTPEKHQAAKFHGQSRHIKAELLGFYAPADAGYLVPARRAVHIHFHGIGADADTMAHVEDFDPEGDSELSIYFPKHN